MINTVRVVFDEKIGNSKLYTTSGPVNAAGTPASGTSNSAQKTQVQAASGAPKGQLRFDGATVNIPAGTTIDRMIDWAVRNSEYISDQLKDPTVTPEQRSALYRVEILILLHGYDGLELYQTFILENTIQHKIDMVWTLYFM